MSCCCNKIYQSCRVPVCGTGKTQQVANATEAGNYKLVLDYLGVDLEINQTFAIDDPLQFPTAGLNENYTYTGKIYDPAGAVVSFTIDDVVYDCLSFQTGLSYVLVEEEVTP